LKGIDNSLPSVELLACVRHQLMHRIDRALGRHHGRSPNLEYLDDMRMLLCSECSDRAGHRFGVVALVNRDNLVVLLGLVEAGGQPAQRFAELASHGMPPLNFRLCLGCDAATARHSSRRCGADQKSARDHLALSLQWILFDPTPHCRDGT
jgi:hypothetical protein